MGKNFKKCEKILVIILLLTKLTFSCEGVILTKRSVGRISRWDFAIDITRCFTLTLAPAGVDRWFVQHDKLCFGQDLYYCQFLIIRVRLLEAV